MSATSYINPNGKAAIVVNFANILDIRVSYNERTGKVTMTPAKVTKGSTVRFHNPEGGKVRIVFLSPCGKETDEVRDSESCTLTTGGTYHVACYFTEPGSSVETSARTGGVIDVIPQRP